jgi:transposase-like protein
MLRWTARTNKAAVALASGKTRAEVAQDAGVDESTVYRWLTNEEFSADVDRLTLMVDIAGESRAATAGKPSGQAEDTGGWLHSQR